MAEPAQNRDAMAVPLHAHVTALNIVLEWMDEHADEIEAAGGVLPPELEDLFDEVAGNIRDKMERVALMERQVKLNEDKAAEESKRIAAHAKGWGNKRGGLRTYLAMQLRRLGETRIDWATVKVRLQAASNPSIRAENWDDPEELPFWKLVPARWELDYRAALDFLQDEGLLDKNKAERLPDGTLRLDLVEECGLVVEWSESAIVW